MTRRTKTPSRRMTPQPRARLEWARARTGEARTSLTGMSRTRARTPSMTKGTGAGPPSDEVTGINP